MKQVERLRDPVHGLIVFYRDDPLDYLAWRLIQAAEFQRLRRIKQLGFSEFVFPGATHTRFSHSVGVFHTARQLVSIMRRLLDTKFNCERATVAVLAALLHDIGHGPFSHAFEEVQRSRGIRKKHEVWSGQIVENPDGGIAGILNGHWSGLAEDVSKMIRAESPSDIYHAIVSSSFDADRMDYIRRDRLMTGVEAGGFDFEWLLNNLSVQTYGPGLDDFPDEQVEILCLNEKALQSAESFLLARFHLYKQLYLHKTTRGFECMFSALLKGVAAHATASQCDDLTGLPPNHPVIKLFQTDEIALEQYLALDDIVLWAAVGAMRSGTDYLVRNISEALWNRKRFYCVNVPVLAPDDEAFLDFVAVSIPKRFGSDFGSTVLMDDPKVSVYGINQGESPPPFLRIMIKIGESRPRDIRDHSDVIKSIGEERLLRFYADTKDKADEITSIVRGARQ